MNSLIRFSTRVMRPGSILCRQRCLLDGQASAVVTRFLSETPKSSDLSELVKKDKVVVFMKGTPAQPMCGFSNAVVQILRMHGVDKYTSFNVLEDQDLRQGVKNFSNWPTIPQVYFNGEFVGGCDILLQMHQNGDLVDELKKLGIRSALLDVDNNEQKK
uniref:Glutaredoxin-related protein 5, mitochondrial n=1 Tax=Erpetoichthys calabaricus TaxID=27687 RepID=A0A8C4TK43_ERPCA